MTQADRQRCHMAASMYGVMDLLEWDMMTYCMFKYECGLMYLEAYLMGDKASIDQMSRSAAYWGWWKLHWLEREGEFIEKCSMAQWLNCSKPGIRREKMEQVYRIVHNAHDLAKCLCPNGVVLEDSYSRDLVPKLREQTPTLKGGVT